MKILTRIFFKNTHKYLKLQNVVSASCAGDIAVLRVGGDALDPGLHLGRDLGEHVGVAVEAVHADGGVSANAIQLPNVLI